MDLDTLPYDALERLAAYQRARDEERKLVAGIETKMVAGEDITERERSIYAYSIFGSASTCGY